ncbi:aspartate kinase [Vibrio diabolicus]|uniref:Aspartokinase n=2 Tax=Vibrio antiquarius (strain Ex25) TaxID=150340 RepID=A0ACA6QK33_VIBAE|nr:MULTISPECIES: aspartate kinase [Vibrio diabolicus subgroup]MCR9607507.1 aspartate kinase [Vibrio alginolyticus]NAW81455.1 aspartate kinase [Vibrio sp. V43_P6S15P86]NNN58720.1 aspartate kinase [Vibrio sp. 1-2 (7-a)]ACY50684.1 aspartokinase [Vibrio antiquarius]MCR9614463.1 aspartate kinase [Vibrio alginolyticus]
MKKPLIVQKFGGTSVGSIERIHQVAEHIIKAKNDGNQVVVVVSAMSGETNRLMDLAKQIDSVPTARELDVLLSAGEQVSMALLAMTLNKMGHAARSLTGAQANIVTDNQHNDATIKHIDTTTIMGLLEQDQIVIVAGFQGVNENGDITTLGRGGSDTSAVALAGALRANECQIFTDVDGIYTCDPRVVKNARKLAVIDFPSMEAMASRGAKVLHLPSVQFAWKNNVPLRVLSTFDVNEGSLVKGESGNQAVSGIAIQRDLAIIEVDKEHLSSATKQCQMLGIDIWNVIEEAERAGIMIKQDACAKFDLVFSDKIRNSEVVSLLTAVGLEANGMVEHACDLLAKRDIEINFSATNALTMMLVLAPECVDTAANILHDAYITSSEALNIQQKHAFLG